jgi:ribosomal protein S5
VPVAVQKAMEEARRKMVKISLKQGTELFAPGQARLAAVRANATFASANTALATNLAAVTTAMNTTLGSPSDH